MAKKFYVQSTVVPENKFEIVALDKTTGKATLKSKYATFEETLTQERLAALRYVVIKEEVSDE